MNHKNNNQEGKIKTAGTFTDHEVMDYEKKRYRGLDQRIVNSREQSLIRRILKTIVKETHGARFLDAPCGYGRFTRVLLTGCDHLVNSDLSFFMVKRAVEHGRSIQTDVYGAAADTKVGLPFKDGAFDLVLSMRFFHHVHEGPERETILREFNRVVKEWVILSYYRTNLLHQMQRKMRRKVKRRQTRISIIPSGIFKKEVTDAGFKIIKSYPVIRGIHSQWIVFLRKVKT